jgi:hypothetical protein
LLHSALAPQMSLTEQGSAKQPDLLLGLPVNPLIHLHKDL